MYFMSYDFKRFESTGGRYEMRISLTGSRSFGFPTMFYEENKIAKYKYVVLYYDEKQKAVGIKFTADKEEPHKFTLIKSKKYGASIVATSFFKKYKLDPKKYKRKYNWKKVRTDFGILFVIELNEGQKSPASENQSAI